MIKKYEELEGRKQLNKRMAVNRDKKDYNITFMMSGLHEDGRVAFQDNQGYKHQLLNIPQPVTVTLKKVGER